MPQKALLAYLDKMDVETMKRLNVLREERNRRQDEIANEVDIRTQMERVYSGETVNIDYQIISILDCYHKDQQLNQGETL